MLKTSFLCILFVFVCSLTHISAAGLRDNPIVGDSIFYLESNWKASNGSLTIPANVPGDLITDLERAKVIGDPLYETNWLDNSGIWTNSDWTYSVSFAYTPEKNAAEVYLVFDGVKMGANIRLNNQLVGVVTDQFRRYSFPVLHFLNQNGQSNTLTVTFPKGAGIDTSGRFMACTGGWDWAPYSNTKDRYGTLTFSKGIWKDVYLVSVSTVALTAVSVGIIYNGSYPTQPLDSTSPAPFNVTLKLYFSSPSNNIVSGALELQGNWSGGYIAIPNQQISSGDTMVQVSMPLTKNDIQLWYPAGLGNQPLYNLTVKFTPTSGSRTTLQTSRRVGFRIFALVTANDSNPSTLEGKDGSGDFTMKFRVNGINVYSRGANMIPMEELEGRASAEGFRYLLNSAKEAHMNTLRVWGGGIFYYDVFYDTCDELGIMIYHDMMYAQQGHSPAVTPTQAAEIRHQIRRLSNHPSIVIWDGCNECGGSGVYASFVVTTIADEDQSRVLWPSSPSGGWQSGADRLWCRPNGKPLVANPDIESPPLTIEDRFAATVGWGSAIEEHGPYKHGSGWPAVNGDSNIRWFDANIPPALPNPSTTGPYVSGYFASEFGCVAMSSFISMAPTLQASHWSLHAPPMFQRNYPCDNIIYVYWGTQNLNSTGEQSFKRQLYQCLLGQALEMKSNIEVRRAGNTFGTLVWQLNEIWPTGGWGSIEYGTVGYTEGQVIGGRWKPLHYVYKQSAYVDVLATCGVNAHCYIRNDLPTPFRGTVQLSLIHFSTGSSTTLQQVSVDLDAGAATTKWFCASQNCDDWSSIASKAGCQNGLHGCILNVTTVDSNSQTVSENLVALTTPGNMSLPAAKVSTQVGQVTNGQVPVTVTSDSVANYVWLTTAASGRFSNNAFLLLPNKPVRIMFIPFGQLNLQQFVSTLTVEHAQQYQ